MQILTSVRQCRVRTAVRAQMTSTATYVSVTGTTTEPTAKQVPHTFARIQIHDVIIKLKAYIKNHP